MRVLVLNAGSSSLKASLVEASSGAAQAEDSAAWRADDAGEATRAGIVADVIRRLTAQAAGDVSAVGYRVVHGGTRFRDPTFIDEAVIRQIADLDELAPLHNRIAVQTIRAARKLMPDASHVACFDTAFHATLEESAWRYPIPAEWSVRWGIRRFGFHGLSVAWATEKAALQLGRRIGELNLVVAHLGAGSSVTAVAGGRSVDTSMGFTPLEGLMMGTRSGSIDPGIVVHLIRKGLAAEEVGGALEQRSGLLGVSGLTADMADLERAAAAGQTDAALALAMYARRAAAGIAAVATSLDGLDALVFTGGIGEHSAPTRSAICQRLRLLGIEPPKSGTSNADALISGRGARVSVIRIHAREDVVIARQTAALLASH
jgi:acetate kinase